jgi:hypothetical protein
MALSEMNPPPRGAKQSPRRIRISWISLGPRTRCNFLAGDRRASAECRGYGPLWRAVTETRVDGACREAAWSHQLDLVSAVGETREESQDDEGPGSFDYTMDAVPRSRSFNKDESGQPSSR